MTTNKDRLPALIEAHPNATLRELGIMRGVSGERVRQIMRSLGLPASAQKKKGKLETRKCARCQIEFFVSKNRRQQFCSVHCSAQTTGDKFRFPPLFLTCDYCGTVFSRSHRRQSQTEWMRHNRLSVKSDRAFCGVVCAGKYNGQARKKKKKNTEEEV